MTLSTEHIQQLFSFTEKKFVRWYDLQVELVDHLANKIEAEMAADSSLSFERASVLSKSNRGFCVLNDRPT